MLREIREAVAQQCPVKMNFCKTSQCSQKSVCGGSILEKLYAYMSATALKRTALPLLSCGQIKNDFFSSFHSNIRSDMFYKIGLFKSFGKLTRKCICRSFFLIKLYTIKPATLLKRAFSSDVLLWILRNCFKQLFYRTFPVSVSCSIQPSQPLVCEGRISIFSMHYLVLDISKPLPAPCRSQEPIHLILH